MARLSDKLPTCQLIEVLREKASARPDVEFDYVGQLDDLRGRVGGEVRFINQLFPEYTPHDEEYHLTRLFHVADTLIGEERYREMNATELFVLACGLYTHDWGMAVSEAERSYVVSGTLQETFSASDFALLPDERSRFDRYLKEGRLDADAVRRDGLSDADWREYVRQTHAVRSGMRARLYFGEIDPGVGDAVGRVAEGHWLDIEKLQDYKLFPPDLTVLRENINLAALAVYVRLVDLLDIGRDRTPYVIWKFVAPRNPRSRMEWNKHRALEPVTCSPYLSGRIVLVDGSTDDHEVYAALEDLHRYCDSQLRECTDLLARLNDPRHLLDLYHIEWRVAARGFDPVLIRFEFDRDRVFEILSDEIYQGDPYVFLRELLQNSIDAIRTRREIVKKRFKGVFHYFGLIRVDVEHGSNRDVRVRWSDDGIGMDDYTVRNYLAVAGKSYYRSEEFEKLGLALDPISKFGIGILSCFMAADRIEIETHRDPYALTPSAPLRIEIPSVTRQFRVEKCSPHDVEIGTTVTVHVDGRRLPNETRRLDVTRYLKIVAGFVEFPILVAEDGRHTLILHPHSDLDPSQDPRFEPYENLEVHRLSLDYPVEEAVLPQDLENARSELVVRSFDLKSDLGLPDYEGRISFLEIRDKTRWVFREIGTLRGIVVRSYGKTDDKTLRWEVGWSEYGGAPSRPVLSKSANPSQTHAVYKNGVLVSNIRLQHRAESARFYAGSRFPSQYQMIELGSGDTSEINISRDAIRTNTDLWYEPVRQRLNQALRELLLADMSGMGWKERLRHFGLFLGTYHLTDDFLNSFPLQFVPVGIIKPGGGFEVRAFESLRNEPVHIIPGTLRNKVRTLLSAAYERQEYDGFFTKWNGRDSVIAEGAILDIAIASCLSATWFLLRQFCHLSTVSLLQPPSEKMPPLVQEIWQWSEAGAARPIEEIANQAVDNPLALSAPERKLLSSVFRYHPGIKYVPFTNPRYVPFRVGEDLINLSHPTGELIFRALSWIYLNSNNTKRDDARTGVLNDAIQAILITFNVDSKYVSAINAKLYSAAFNLGLIKSPSPTADISPTDLWYIGRQQIDDARTPFGRPV